MSDASGEKMKRTLEKMGFTPIGRKTLENGDIFVGEREAWLGEPISRKCMEVVYFIVSGDITHGTPATSPSCRAAGPGSPSRS